MLFDINFSFFLNDFHYFLVFFIKFQNFLNLHKYYNIVFEIASLLNPDDSLFKVTQFPEFIKVL